MPVNTRNIKEPDVLRACFAGPEGRKANPRVVRSVYASYGPTAWQLLCIPTSFRTRHRTARPPNAWTQARDTIATSSKGIATSSKGITTSSKVSQTIHVWNIIGTVAYMKEAQSSHRQSCKMWRTLLGVDDFGSKTWIEQTHEHVHLLSAQKKHA